MRRDVLMLTLSASLMGSSVGAGPGHAAPSEPVAEAKAQGFNVRPDDEGAGSLLGGLLAAGPGFFVHGLGHYYAGERDTATTLLLTELAAIALVAASAALGALTDDAGEYSAAQKVLGHAGAILFVGSWSADVLGTLKGAVSFSEDTSRLDGSVFGMGYRYTADRLTDFSHHLVGHLDLDRRWIYMRTMLDLESHADAREMSFDLGTRLTHPVDPHEHIFAGARYRRREIPIYGLATRSMEGYVGWKLDLGHQIRSMRNFYIVTRLAYGMQDHLFAQEVGKVPGLFSDADLTDTYIAMKSGFEVNSGRQTHLSLMFIQDPTHEVAPLSPDTGVIEASLLHRYDDSLDIEFRYNGGDGWAVWLGLGYAL